MKKMSNWLSQKSFSKKDEVFTPKILTDLIVQYLPKKAKVLCPFDTENSEFVLSCKEKKINVDYGHIKTGQDFFKLPKKNKYTHIVSNPPFSKKKKVFEHLFFLGKPFAMLMGLPVLNYQEIGDFFYQQQEKGFFLQLLIPDKKVSFDGNTSSFCTAFFCYNFLKYPIIFRHLSHNNTGKNFVRSRMIQDFDDEGNPI